MTYTKISRAAALRSARIAADIQTLINNREYYQFQYTPLTGPLPGLSFEQQTEDAINDIGNMSYGSYEIATQALTTANQAYSAAQSAIEIANHAETTAQNAQISANNAATAAANAQTAADNATTAAYDAQTTANTAVTAASNAQTAADNAQASANTANTTATAAQTTADTAQNDATSALNRLDSITPIVDELRYYNNIDTAVDLNDKTEFAREFLEAPNNTNAPETGSGWLDVDDDFNETYIRQKFMGQASGKTYVRFGTIVPDSDPVTVSEWSNWVEYTLKSDLDNTTTDLTEKINTVATDLAGHEADYNNPHKVTAEQLGLATVYVYKDSVATYADLPTSGQKIGDVYNIETADPDHGIKAGDNVAWNGTKWDVLAGNHDLSGYAQLNSSNTFTALNAFRANLAVSNGTTAGSSGSISFGISPADETVQARISTDLYGGLFYHASTNQPHVFRNGSNLNSLVIRANDTNMALSSGNTIFATVNYTGGIRWLGNANTATKLETARTINGVAFDGTKDITIAAGGGGGDVTAAGNNTFTGDNTFRKNITVMNDVSSSEPGGGGGGGAITGAITLGSGNGPDKALAITGSPLDGKLSVSQTGGSDIISFTSWGPGGSTGYGEAIVIGYDGKAAQIVRDPGQSALKFYTTLGTSVGPQVEPADLEIEGTQVAIKGNELSFNSGADTTKSVELYNSVFDEPFLTVSSLGTGNVTLCTPTTSTGAVTIKPQQKSQNTTIFDANGLVTVAQNLTVGNGNPSNTSTGVIRAGNAENCLYFTGTAENTYYATPNTGNTISYQAAANCYLINCSINNPSNLTMNFSGMNFKATIGSVPYMTKTLSFFIYLGTTVPTVAWTFPTGAAVYYPSGTAPTLTANAANIINVIAIVDDTDSFSIQVCDTVAIPYA